jgi:hypothetical protein
MAGTIVLQIGSPRSFCGRKIDDVVRGSRVGWLRAMRPAWRIPGVGVLHPCIDRVVIVSTASVGSLKSFLPIAVLKGAFHSFEVITYDGPDPRLKSRIIVVGAGDEKVWQLLKRHEYRLKRYWITGVELAFDVNCLLEDVQVGLNALIARLDKRWHQRGHLRLISTASPTVSRGYLPYIPTVYYEDRQSSVSIKCYGRRAKLPAGSFGTPMIRLEWTLSGKRALERHIGGNQINALLAADLNAFLKSRLRLAHVDHVNVGKLFTVKRNSNQVRNIRQGGAPPILKRDPNYWAERRAFLVLRALAYRESARLGEEDALHICQESPAQVRGYLRSLRVRGKRLTDYRIDRCFRPVDLLPV